VQNSVQSSVRNSVQRSVQRSAPRIVQMQVGVRQRTGAWVLACTPLRLPLLPRCRLKYFPRQAHAPHPFGARSRIRRMCVQTSPRFVQNPRGRGG